MARPASYRAQKAARTLIRDTGSGFPVDVFALAAERATVIAEPLEDEVSGMLVIDLDKATIVVNETHPPSRQRFTVAHELGHLLLHQPEDRVFFDRNVVLFRDSASSDGNQSQEVEANAFAAELLMPEDTLRSFLAGRPMDAFDEAGVRRLARTFGVSAQALTIRLTRLGLINV